MRPCSKVSDKVSDCTCTAAPRPLISAPCVPVPASHGRPHYLVAAMGAESCPSAARELPWLRGADCPDRHLD